MRGNFRLDKASWFLESGLEDDDEDDAALAGLATVAVVAFAEKRADLLLLVLPLPFILIAFRENKERDDVGRMRLWRLLL